MNQPQPSISRPAVHPRIMATEMTLRDYFAINAPWESLELADNATYGDECIARYKFADAMLKARQDGT